MQYTIIDNDQMLGYFQHETTKELVALGALDIETTVEPNPWVKTPQLVAVAVTFDGKEAFIFRDDKYLREAHLEGFDWIMHNGLFDKLMMEAFFGIKLTLAHDTMAMQYLLDPDEPKGLQDLAVKYLGADEYKDVDYMNILDEPFEKVAQMNAQDVCHTYNIFRPLASKINMDRALSRVYQWIIMPVIPELIKTTITGVHVDEDRFSTMHDLVAKQVHELLAWLEKFTAAPRVEAYPNGWPKPSWWRVRMHGKWEGQSFNPSSPKQVAHILYDVWGLPTIELTATGQPSTGADVLLQLETYYAEGEQQEWLTKLRQYRKQKKLMSSYLESWPELWDMDHLLHPRYKPLHVVTGRLSSESPNIQQVPRDKDFRNMLGGQEGYSWIKADYSQIELRVAAWLAKESLMLAAYDKGEDLHRMTARLVLGDDSDDARQVGKTLNFGLLYGAGPRTLQRVARSQYEVFLSYEEAARYHARFFEAYPGLADWHRQMESFLARTGQVRSPLGRIRYLPNARIPWSVEDMRTKKIQAIHEGLNHPVQSFANDLLLHSLITAAPKLRSVGAQVVAVVHDEIDVICPDMMKYEAADILKEEMEDLDWLRRFGINLTVPVLAEVEVGSHWGSLKELT